MQLTPHHFVNQDDSSSELARVQHSEALRSTSEKIESILSQLGMSRDDLIELLSALLGLSASEVSIEENQVTIAENEDELSLEDAIDDETLHQILDQLELLQRLRILAANGHEIEMSELEALIASSEGKLDKKTLQMVLFSQQQAMRRLLNSSEIATIRDAISRAEYAYVIADTITSSGDSTTQNRVIEEINQRALHQGQKIEMGKNSQLFIRYEQTTQQQQQDTVSRLIREDYRMDMKRLLDATKSAVASVFSAMRQGNKKEAPAREKGSEDAKLRKSLQDDQVKQRSMQSEQEQSAQLTKHSVKRESDELKDELQKIDHASDMRAAMKAMAQRMKSMFKKAGGSDANEAREKDHWERDEEKRDIAKEEKARPHDERILDKPGVIMTKEDASKATDKDQQTLVKLDVLHDKAAYEATTRKSPAKAADNLKNLAKESRHALAQSAMQKASSEVSKMSSKEALQEAASTMAKGAAAMGKMSDASLDKVSESLDKVKDHKQVHGKEIS